MILSQRTPFNCFVSAFLIAAVDTVAVLAIFQKVGVNKRLYVMLIGASLLDDAITCHNLHDFKDPIEFLGKFAGLPLRTFLEP
ncbi:unnamed protein product [Cylicocyclus nassatus]|uniref:Cation/H+ exchanger transmembrane domain-containing protein n=1 Tax=Cylicocyclus nassatus TaxID=53992 RepID=A0AA36GTP8_CYLNA|nr:unnamed protein product [Cylicocyclus nassatus]